MEKIPPRIILNNYEEILVKVKEREQFHKEDIKDNDINVREYGDSAELPSFVEEFNRKLDRKPSLDPVRCFVDFPVSYSILMDRCRRILHGIIFYRMHPIVNHILSFPKATRPLDRNLTGQRAMPSYRR